jgi:transposase-like protein
MISDGKMSAVDRDGEAVDFLLTAHRDEAATRRFSSGQSISMGHG